MNLAFIVKSNPIDYLSFMTPILIGAFIGMLIHIANKMNREDLSIKLIEVTGLMIIVGTVLLLLIPFAIMGFVIYVKYFAKI